MWMIKVDKQKPNFILSNKILDDVHEFYEKKFKKDTRLVTEDPIYL
jgi:hypothetical protein